MKRKEQKNFHQDPANLAQPYLTYPIPVKFVYTICRMSPWRGQELDQEYRMAQESRARLTVSVLGAAARAQDGAEVKGQALCK